MKRVNTTQAEDILKDAVEGNGKDVPIILAGNGNAEKLVERLREETRATEKTVDLSKYYVMEGMQNIDKVKFFSDFENRDDVLRMNTIEAFVNVAPLVIRKTSTKNMEKIEKLLNDVYSGHVDTHKINVVSLARGRESAYTKILSSDSSDSGVVPTGLKKFFGIGKSK